MAVDNGELVWSARAVRYRTLPRAGSSSLTAASLRPVWWIATRIWCLAAIAAEFEQRLNGVSYAEIAAQGGGILSTVRATRGQPAAAGGFGALAARSPAGRRRYHGGDQIRLRAGRRERAHSAARYPRAGAVSACRCAGHLPAAHGIPPEFRDNPQGWIDIICQRLLPRVKAEGLADAVDAFCEHGAVTAAGERGI